MDIAASIARIEDQATAAYARGEKESACPYPAESTAGLIWVLRFKLEQISKRRDAILAKYQSADCPILPVSSDAKQASCGVSNRVPDMVGAD